MRNPKTAAIAVLIAAALLVAAAIADDATPVTVALGLPVQGGEAVVALAGVATALTALAFGVRELRRVLRARRARARARVQRRRSSLPLRLTMFL